MFEPRPVYLCTLKSNSRIANQLHANHQSTHDFSHARMPKVSIDQAIVAIHPKNPVINAAQPGRFETIPSFPMFPSRDSHTLRSQIATFVFSLRRILCRQSQPESSRCVRAFSTAHRGKKIKAIAESTISPEKRNKKSEIKNWMQERTWCNCVRDTGPRHAYSLLSRTSHPCRTTRTVK